MAKQVICDELVGRIRDKSVAIVSASPKLLLFGRFENVLSFLALRLRSSSSGLHFECILHVPWVYFDTSKVRIKAYASVFPHFQTG